MEIEQAITIVRQILMDNAEGANTRYRMLGEEEVEAIGLLIERK